jgi:Bacterial transcriptional activator domain
MDFYLRRLAADDLAEEFYQELIRWYQQIGRRAEALAVYRRLRQTLLVTFVTRPLQLAQARIGPCTSALSWQTACFQLFLSQSVSNPSATQPNTEITADMTRLSAAEESARGFRRIFIRNSPFQSKEIVYERVPFQRREAKSREAKLLVRTDRRVLS